MNSVQHDPQKNSAKSPADVSQRAIAFGDQYVYVKSERATSPSMLKIADLPAWAYRCGGNVRCHGTYVGSHFYPPTSIPTAAEDIAKFDPSATPHRYSMRLEADGKDGDELQDACKKMVSVVRTLQDVNGFAFLRRDRVQDHFNFFSTGQRSIYAVARRYSAAALTGWDDGMAAIAEAIDTHSGGGLIDANLYHTPRAPGRAYFTRHEKSSYFNVIPFEWVAGYESDRIRNACANPATDDWVNSWSCTVGAFLPQGGPLYDALIKHVEATRFASAVDMAGRLPRLPNCNRPDYAALIVTAGFRVTRTKHKHSTTFYVLDRCPYCNRPGHAQVSEFGKLRCFATSCLVGTDGVPAAGDAGWLKKLGIPLPDTDDEIAEPADPHLDRYPSALTNKVCIDTASARTAIRSAIENFLVPS